MIVAISVPSSFKLTSFAKLFDSGRNVIGNAHHFVQKRQSSEACIRAYLETEQPRFSQCSSLFTDGGSDLTVDQLVTFCDHDCVSLLTRVFTDLEECDSNNTTVSILNTLLYSSRALTK